MPYLSRADLESMGFASLGRDVQLSDKAAVYDAERISIGDHSRIDDFCVLAGALRIGRNVHVTVFNNLAGGLAGIELEDFVTLAYGCHVVAQTDDYSGATMTNSTIPRHLTGERSERVSVQRHAILGTGTVVLPGVTVGQGTATGARTLVTRSTDPWSIYVGTPARRLRSRKRDLLALEQELLASEPHLPPSGPPG